MENLSFDPGTYFFGDLNKNTIEELKKASIDGEIDINEVEKIKKTLEENGVSKEEKKLLLTLENEVKEGKALKTVKFISGNDKTGVVTLKIDTPIKIIIPQEDEPNTTEPTKINIENYSEFKTFLDKYDFPAMYHDITNFAIIDNFKNLPIEETNQKVIDKIIQTSDKNTVEELDKLLQNEKDNVFPKKTGTLSFLNSLKTEDLTKLIQKLNTFRAFKTINEIFIRIGPSNQDYLIRELARNNEFKLIANLITNYKENLVEEMAQDSPYGGIDDIENNADALIDHTLLKQVKSIFGNEVTVNIIKELFGEKIKTLKECPPIIKNLPSYRLKELYDFLLNNVDKDNSIPIMLRLISLELKRRIDKGDIKLKEGMSTIPKTSDVELKNQKINNLSENSTESDEQKIKKFDENILSKFTIPKPLSNKKCEELIKELEDLTIQIKELNSMYYSEDKKELKSYTQIDLLKQLQKASYDYKEEIVKKFIEIYSDKNKNQEIKIEELKKLRTILNNLSNKNIKDSLIEVLDKYIGLLQVEYNKPKLKIDKEEKSNSPQTENNNIKLPEPKDKNNSENTPINNEKHEKPIENSSYETNETDEEIKKYYDQFLYIDLVTPEKLKPHIEWLDIQIDNLRKFKEKYPQKTSEVDKLLENYTKAKQINQNILLFINDPLKQKDEDVGKNLADIVKNVKPLKTMNNLLTSIMFYWGRENPFITKIIWDDKVNGKGRDQIEVRVDDYITYMVNNLTDQELKTLDNYVINKLIDYIDDPIRDGNLFNLDNETKKIIDRLRKR